MTEQVGAITYLVDMDTAAVTKGADRVNAALDSLGQGATKLDSSMSRASGSLNDAAKATDKEAAALRQLLGQINPTVAATQRLDDMTEALGKAFDKGQISVKQYEANLATLNAQYKKVEGGTEKASISADGFGAKLAPLAGAIAAVISVQTLKQWGELAEQFTLLQSRIARLTPDLATAGDTYKQLLATAGATGQTLPATVKLWETLTSSLKTLGATNDQVLTLTSTLQKIGKIGGSSAEETANALRQLGQSLAGGTLRAEEYNSIVEQTPELIRQLASASGKSMGEFRQAMLDGKITAAQLFDLLMQRVPAVNAEFEKMPRSAADAGNAVSVAFGAALSKLDQALGASTKLANALDGLAHSINNISGNLTGQEKLNSLLEDQADIQRQIDFQNDRFFGADKKRLQELTDLQKKNNDEIELQRKSMAKTPTATGAPAAPTTSPDGQKELKRLQDQAEALRVQGVERAQILAVQKLGAGATAEEIKQAKQLATEIYNQQEAEKQAKKDKSAGVAEAKKDQTELNRQAKEYLDGTNKASQGIQNYADKLEMASLKGQDLDDALLEAEKISARASLGDLASPDDIKNIDQMVEKMHELNQQKALLSSLKSDVPLVGAGMNYEDQLKKYQEYRNAQLISDQQYVALKTQAEKDYNAQVLALQEQQFKAASQGNALLLNGIDALGQSGTQALSGLLSGTSSLKDALGGVANTVLNSVIGSFVTAGTEWVKQEVIKQAAVGATTAAQTTGMATVAGVQAATTGAIAATTTATAATTGTAVASSMAPAAGLSSIASFGGAAVIGGAALLATMLLAKSFGGGRQYGGGVSANKMYRVNEGGAPEIFNAAGGKQYMMPNSRGEVVSNKDATSGGSGAGAPVVNVNNYSGTTASATTRFSEADRKWVTDVIVGDMSSGGQTRKVVNQVTGTKSRGS